MRRIVGQAWHDIMNNHTMAFAAGLSYYFVLSLFPLLILLASVVGFLPIPDLFDNLLDLMARFMPAESMSLVRKIVESIIIPERGALLTFGILGTLWTASSGFAAMIEALNVAYDIPETRAIWKTRLVALQLTLVEGVLLISAMAVMIVGPRFGEWLAFRVHFVGPAFAYAWPYARWTIAILCVVLAVEILFFWGPNVRQRFWATLPGAIIGVGFWIGSSHLLSLYFVNYANFNATYGTLGAAMALMVWLYWSSFMILIGAEINSELLKEAHSETLELKGKPPAAVKPRAPYEERPIEDAAA